MNNVIQILTGVETPLIILAPEGRNIVHRKAMCFYVSRYYSYPFHTDKIMTAQFFQTN